MAERRHRTHFDLSASDRATSVFKTVEGGLTGLQAKYAAVAAAGVALFAAGGAASFVTDATRYRATLDDIADTTGDNVRNIDGMARAWRVAGGEVEQLGSTLAKFARNLNAADDEGKAAAQAIEAIGLNVDELRAMKPAEAMLEVARALGKYEDGASKVAVAVALMGKEGAAALPFFKDLAESGEIQGRITAEQAAQAERLEKEWRKLKLALADGKDEIADALIPVLADFSAELREAIRLTGGLFGAVKLFARDIGRGFATPGEQIKVLNAEIETLRKNQAQFQARGDAGLARSLEGTIASKQTYVDYLKFLQRQDAEKLMGPGSLDARDLQAQQKPKLAFVPQGPAKAEPKETKSPRLTPMQIAKMQAEGEEEFSEQVSRWAKEQIEDQKRFNDELKKSAEHYRDLVDPLRKYAREWAELDRLLRLGVLTPEEYTDAYLKVAEAADKARLEMENLNDEAKRSKNAFAEMGFTATSALEDIILKGGQAGDVIRALIMDLARMALRRQVLDPIAAGAGPLLDKIFGGGGSGKASTGDFSAGGGFENVDWAGAFAGGGSFTVGGQGGTDSRLVAFRATPGERVDISRPGERGGAPTIVNLTVNNAVGIRGEVRAELAMQARAFKRLARDAVAEARDRGGR